MNCCYLAVEDALSEALGRKLIAHHFGPDIDITVLMRNGNGYLKTNISKFIDIARHYPLLLITDLDNLECAPSLKKSWLNGRREPEEMVFRVAVREVETWLLADFQGFAGFLGLAVNAFPAEPESIADPKAALLKLASKCRNGKNKDILPKPGSTSKIGLGYNDALCGFVENDWDLIAASGVSNSLNRAYIQLERLSVKYR